MNVGMLLTLGLGSFGDANALITLGFDLSGGGGGSSGGVAVNSGNRLLLLGVG